MSYEWYRRVWWMMGFYGGVVSGLMPLALYLEPKRAWLWLLILAIAGTISTAGYINNALDANQEREDA